MKMNEFSRMQVLVDDLAMTKLAASHVAIFGIGGVGGYVAEGVARCGVGEITLVDGDIVDITNINRQLIAMHSTLGRHKVDVMQERILDINPRAKVHVFKTFYSSETKDQFDMSGFSYVVDAIDMIPSKVLLIEQANKSGTQVISAMGAGNKADPTMFQVTDIYETSVCPLAKIMRRELKKRDIDKLRVVYSKEEPIKPKFIGQQGEKIPPGSFSFVPSVMGFILASEIIKDIVL